MGVHFSWQCQGSEMGRKAQGKLPGSHLSYLRVIWNVRIGRSRIYHGTGKEEKSVLLFDVYYCENTIINYFLEAWLCG